LFDSYQVPIRGVFLRRTWWWIYSASHKQDVELPLSQIKDVAVATDQAVCWCPKERSLDLR